MLREVHVRLVALASVLRAVRRAAANDCGACPCACPCVAGSTAADSAFRSLALLSHSKRQRPSRLLANAISGACSSALVKCAGRSRHLTGVRDHCVTEPPPPPAGARERSHSGSDRL